MKTFNIKYSAEIHGIRTIKVKIIAESEADAVSKFQEKSFERYLVVNQTLIETPMEGSLEVTLDTGQFDVV